MDKQLRSVASLLKSARRVLFVTGAGVSAESGIPTFRGTAAAFADGTTEEGVRFEDVLWQFQVQLEQGFELVFSVGTTSIFEYVIRPVVMARRAGIPTVEINPEETGISDFVDFRFASKAGSILKGLLEAERAL